MTESGVPFTRQFSGGETGIDVEGVGRALCRAGWFMHLDAYNKMPRAWRRTYGWRKQEAVNKLRKAEGWNLNGQYTLPVHYRLVDDGGFDAYASSLMAKYEPPKPPTDYERIAKSISDFCIRAEAHESVWHYTQNRPFSGFGAAPEHLHYADCSSYVILTYYWARQETKVAIPDPSGYSYKGWGNTWDDLDGHSRVMGPFLVGDLAHYEGHVTLCRKPGTAQTAVWSSFGREAGPNALDLNYRNDLRFVVRPPLK